MIGPARIRQVATATGFREEIVEKVLYLEAILDQLCRHPDLVTRRAARDAFDAWQLLERVPDLLGRPELRLAFDVQIAGGRHDARRFEPRGVTVSLKEVRDSLLPLLRVESRPFDGDVEADLTKRHR